MARSSHEGLWKLLECFCRRSSLRLASAREREDGRHTDGWTDVPAAAAWAGGCHHGRGGQEKHRRPGPHSLEQRAWLGHSSAGRGTSGPVLSPHRPAGEPRIIRSRRATAKRSHGAHLIK